MKLSSLCFTLISVAMLTSCTSFEKEWKTAVAAYEDGAIKSPEGPWAGSWTTNTNGHTGNLRAIVKESKKNPGEYDFRYHATWAKIFSGSYTVSFPVVGSGSNYRVDGEHNLGPFGTFGHKGKIQGNSFTATYFSDKGDLGDFKLARP
ncbi:MAG: hypothetical protein P1U58_00325 [Verrucomicrobiales bacterium]|nr:hypothetical protein [Verrucomicrobiales bacterium]